MSPVHVIHLYLDEVPFVPVVVFKEVVEYLYIPVVGKAEVSDAAFLPFLEQEFEHPVIYVTGAEFGHAVVSHSDSVQQQIVDMVDLEFLERIAVHFH